MRSLVAPALFLSLCAPAVDASERAVARLAQVAGSVLVSNDHDIAAAGEGLRLAPGMRVLMTQGSRALVVYADGCRVALAPGDRFEVVATLPCAERRPRSPVLTAVARAGLR